jgi:phenylpropionate dioxygenase-like ring-hydroxylating dioxygenase large terminal subunit
MVIEQAGRAVEATQDTKQPSALQDVRPLIPELGLKEYWYPAIEARKVKASKPLGLLMLGEQLVLFRDKNGEVSALWNVCPHRGGSLMHGDCHFPGTVACPYHGWTFDGEGNVLAVLPEGPDSKIPGKVKAKVYPTRTLRGMVFIWMGDGEPAPIEEDIPPEFFRDDGIVLYATEVWPANWRLCIENVSDAHVPYVHRDAMLVLLNPMGPTGAVGARTRIVNNRSLVSSRPQITSAGAANTNRTGRPAKWRKRRRRWLFAWATNWTGKRRYTRPSVETEEEWSGILRHLPAEIRLDYHTHTYTRNNIPINADSTREIYFHYSPVKSWLGKLYEHIHFKLFHRWAMYANFSKQDFRAVQPQRYDVEEYLSSTDAPNVNWRRLLLKARGMESVEARGEVPATPAEEFFRDREIEAGMTPEFLPDKSS